MTRILFLKMSLSQSDTCLYIYKYIYIYIYKYLYIYNGVIVAKVQGQNESNPCKIRKA